MLRFYAVTHTLPVESGLWGLSSTKDNRAPFADSNLIVMLVYTVIFWSFPFFFLSQNGLDSAAALWDSLDYSVFMTVWFMNFLGRGS